MNDDSGQPQQPAAARALDPSARRGRLASLLLVVALAVAPWLLFDRPVAVPAWPAVVTGYAFSPMRAGEAPEDGRWPAAANIDRDLALLAAETRAVRTYTVAGTLADVPALASAHGLRVTLGAWLSGEPVADRAELERALAIAEREPAVERLVLGNETLLRGDLEPDALVRLLDAARGRASVPVGTAEPWHVWLQHPELAAHVDYIAVHVLPYWEGVPVEHAVRHVADRLAAIERRFPGKPVLLGEVGWPSDGRPRAAATASLADQAVFLRAFLAAAGEHGWDYFLMEAFDQPWKRSAEGAVGAYWGVRDVDREPKFARTGAVSRVADRPLLAFASALLALLAFRLLTVDGERVGWRGRVFLAAVAAGVASPLVYTVHDYATRYLVATDVLVGVVLGAGCLAVLLVLFAEAHEWAEAHWCTGRRRPVPSVPADPAWRPFVSVHLAIHDEPPGMVAETLAALAALDYDAFEVVVVDNNTTDPARWRPVQALCARLGPRFRFVHVEGLAGFKAGALNLARQHTAPAAEVIAVVDADYRVEPGWLRELAPLFADEQVVVVQAPQDYRDGDRSLFKRMCEAEYRGFFHIGMVTRNDRNAIIQHGTMTLVRRRALEGAGGWGEWTITEDAELGLRLLEHGGETLYVARSHGRGLVPDTFLDYRRQRFRWVFGAMQILRAHRRALFTPGDRRLRAGQRYHFVAGWLPWLADGLNLLFTLAAVAWCLLMVLWPARFDPPLLAFSCLPLSVFAFRMAKLAFLYRRRVGATVGQTFGAAVAGLALTHTVGRAVLAGLAGGTRPFDRTPKHVPGDTLPAALLAVREELLLGIALLTSAAAVGATQTLAGIDVRLWQAVLVTQAVPYVAALATAIIATLPPHAVPRPLPAAT